MVSGKGNFTPAPEGLHLGVCCEVIDLGEQELNWKGEVRMERCVQLVFQIEEEDKNGDRYEIRQRYTAKIGPKAKLGRFLVGWRGKSFTEEERKAFDLEVLVGKCCQLQVIHNETEGGVYANIEAALPLAKGQSKIEPHKYVRLSDREGAKQPGPKETQVQLDQEDDSSIPF